MKQTRFHIAMFLIIIPGNMVLHSLLVMMSLQHMSIMD